MKKLNLLIASAYIAISAVCFTSCSTIVNGSRQDVSIKATPDNAKIYVDGELVGTGTANIKMKRGKEHVVEVKADGYRTAKVTTDKSITGWFWGNLICGGIPGGAVDLISGSAYDVDPDNIVITLDRGTGSIQIPTTRNFGELNVVTPEGEQIATLTVEWD